MIIKNGRPDEVINRAVSISGKTVPKHLFTFDKNGEFKVPPGRLYEFMAVKDRLTQAGYEVESHACKYCGEEFSTKGKLLAHYKKCEYK